MGHESKEVEYNYFKAGMNFDLKERVMGMKNGVRYWLRGKMY